MRKYVLMEGNEPTDEELSELMKEVALEAKMKAEDTNKKLHEYIYNEIMKVYHPKEKNNE